jgi:HPt (histidine-containing phosphotransfer) domain-containing protein
MPRMIARKKRTSGRTLDMSESSLLTVPGLRETPPIIDDDHLGRMTLGDRSLEREVLEIFARQIAMILKRIAAVEPARAAAAAHTLKGSARGVGAWRVAQAAERLERAAREGGAQAMGAAIMELEAASSEVRAAIGARLGDCLDEPTDDTLVDRWRDH